EDGRAPGGRPQPRASGGCWRPTLAWPPPPWTRPWPWRTPTAAAWSPPSCCGWPAPWPTPPPRRRWPTGSRPPPPWLAAAPAAPRSRPHPAPGRPARTTPPPPPPGLPRPAAPALHDWQVRPSDTPELERFFAEPGVRVYDLAS